MHQPINIIHLHDTLLSDHHKEAFGFRPRGLYKTWWTSEELNDEHDSLQRICEDKWDEENSLDLEAQQDFENHIQATIDIGAKDRTTALRWMLDSIVRREDCPHVFGQDIEHELWKRGIGFGIMEMYVTEVHQALEVAA